LNAKNHEREAEIIAKAGHKGSVTIATNMAGRGTDIKLGDGVVEIGGLAVIGSERHESRRIDNQLRGRSGRQGDPGYSRFYLSGEDELMVRFGGDSFKQRLQTLERMNSGSNEPLSSKIFTRFVTNAQKRIEGNNFDARKNVLKYDDVLRKQREIIYKERRDVLLLETVEPQVLRAVEQTIKRELAAYIHTVDKTVQVDYEGIFNHYNQQFFKLGVLDFEYLKTLDELSIEAYLVELAHGELAHKKAETPETVYKEFLKIIMLRVIDTYWTGHIDTMSELRQGVSLQSYGQQNPLMIYQQEGLRLFNTMIENIARDITKYVLRAHIEMSAQREAVVKNTSTNQGMMTTNKKPRKPKVRRNRSQRSRPF
jgi:preprotein translocase subunit SecA